MLTVATRRCGQASGTKTNRAFGRGQHQIKAAAEGSWRDVQVAAMIVPSAAGRLDAAAVRARPAGNARKGD